MQQIHVHSWLHLLHCLFPKLALLLSFRLCPSLRTHSLLHRNTALSQGSRDMAKAHEFRVTLELSTAW